VRAQSHALGEEIVELERFTEELGTTRQEILDGLPNVPDDDVQRVARSPTRSFAAAANRRNLVRRARSCDSGGEPWLVDYKRGAKLGGTGSWIYTVSVRNWSGRC